MKIHLIYIFTFSLIISLSGCNGDIFTDDKLPENSFYSIEGDGGQASFVFSQKGLHRIYIENNLEQTGELTYYNKDSKPISPETNASEISSISYESVSSEFTVGLNGQIITFNSLYQNNKLASYWTLVLQYDYGNKYVNFEINPGKPLQFVYYQPYSEIKVSENISSKYGTVTYKNSSSEQVNAILYPYLQSIAKISIKPTNNWANNLKIEHIDIPVYEPLINEWVLDSQQNVVLGREWTYSVPYRMTEELVSIKPNSTTTISTKINYSQATLNGKVVYRNQVTGQELESNIIITSIFPTSYEVNID